MFRIDSDGAVEANPGYEAIGETSGYFSPGDPEMGVLATVLSAEWANHVQEEIAQAIEEFGPELTKSNDGQLASVLAARIHAILCHATDTGEVTTEHLRAVIASATSQSYAARSAVLASEDGISGGANSAVIGSKNYSTTGPQTAAIASEDSSGAASAVAGENAAVIGCESSTINANTSEALVAASTNGSTTPSSATSHMAVLASHLAEASGPQTAALASKGALGGPVAISVSGENAATIASVVSAVGSDNGGTQSLVAASDDGTVTDGINVALIATDDCEIVGGNPLQAGIMASQGCYLGASGNVLLVGSANAECYNRTNGLALGYSGTPISASGSDTNIQIFLDPEDATGYADAWSTAGADFAEYFECGDDSEIPVGSLVTRRGKRVHVAQPGDRVFGIVSAAPSIVGNDAELAWSGRYAKDEWGRDKWREIPYVRWSYRGKVVFDGPLADAPKEPPKSAEHYTVRDRTPNPDFDQTREYVPRRDRPAEWCAVGLVGQLRCRVLSDVQVDDFVRAGIDGIGSRSDTETKVEVMDITQEYDPDKGYAIAHVVIR